MNRAELIDLLPPSTNGDGPKGRRALHVVTTAEIRPRPVKWLWDRRIPLGALTLLAGREGVGKSTIAYSLAAQVTRGELPGRYHGVPRSVIVAATEDSWEHTIVPRLMAAGADLSRVLKVGVTTGGGVHGHLSFPDDLGELKKVIADNEVALLLLDPLLSRLDSGLDTHKDAEVRLALEPLTGIAEDATFAIVGLIHVNKSYSNDPLQLIMGSRAFSAVARSVLFALADGDDDGLFHLGMPKNNLGRTDLPTLDYRIDEAQVDQTDEGAVWASFVKWVGESNQSVRDLLEASGDTEMRTATKEASEWLADYLRSVGGTSASAKVKEEGKRAGHNAEALKRARRQLRIQVTASGFPRITYWSTPGPFVQSNDSRGGSSPTDPTDAIGESVRRGQWSTEYPGETTLLNLTNSTDTEASGPPVQSGQSGQWGQSPREGDPTGRGAHQWP